MYERTLFCPQFQRFVSGGSFYVESGTEKKKDLIPPSRIIDFRQIINPISGNITFQWTATGQDFHFGKGK